MDAAALITAVVDVPREAQRELCIRAGYLCLRKVAAYFKVEIDSKPTFPATPISITRAEFDAVCDQLAATGVPLKPDRDKAWLDFAGWRVNYDRALILLCALTMAPSAPWSSDRSPQYQFRPLCELAVTLYSTADQPLPVLCQRSFDKWQVLPAHQSRARHGRCQTGLDPLLRRQSRCLLQACR